MKRWHWPLMIVGCLIPVVLLAAVFRTVDEVSSLFLLGFLLLCPAVHLLLMRDHPIFGHPGSDEATIDHD
jgi:hypothetical protein